MKTYGSFFLIVLIFISACTNIYNSDLSYPETSTGGAVYKDFNKADYEQALQEGKIIYLEFSANWCPICRSQEPEIRKAFKVIDDDSIVGFKVHYNDDEVTADEQNLARQYGVSYQHTKVIINKEGKIVKKSLEYWSKDRIIDELNSIT